MTEPGRARRGAYHRPRRLDEALALLASPSLEVLAGGTDYYPVRVGRRLDDDVLDITGIDALGSIDVNSQRTRLGATVTWTQLLRAQRRGAMPPEFRAYAQAAQEVGGVQIQNAGTLVGNLCNASPAADGTPNLLALDAQVELACAGAVRTLPVTEFVRGNRSTARRPGELVVAVDIPRLSVPAGGRAGSAFYKLGARHYLVISIVMVSAVLVTDAQGCVADARVAVGACSAVPQRLAPLEQRLVGRHADARALSKVPTVEDVATLTPIDDVRATADYRTDAALTCVQRALADAAQAARSTEAA